MPNNVHNNLAEEISQYFDALATQSVFIDYDGASGNYKEMGMDEIIALGSNLDFKQKFGMIYEPIEIMLSGKSLNDVRATPGIALWFIKYAKDGDFAQRKAVEEEAFRIANHFFGRIKHDQEQYTKGLSNDMLFKNLDLSTVKFEKTGMIGDSHYGYILQFEVFNDGKIEYDAAEWTA